MKKGLFITFEGCDGSGKSTTLDKVCLYLKEQGYDIVQTREPGGSKIATEIRGILLNEDNDKLCDSAEALLFAASRAQHYEEIIKPALDAGKIVICDRFIDSSLAYQGYARKLGIDKILAINNFAINQHFPDLTLFFDLEPKLGLERIAKSKEREINRLDLENINFHEKVYRGYQEVMHMYPQRFIKINANQDKESVLNQVINTIKEKINGKF